LRLTGRWVFISPAIEITRVAAADSMDALVVFISTNTILIYAVGNTVLIIVVTTRAAKLRACIRAVEEECANHCD